jgi:hypothetical protein
MDLLVEQRFGWGLKALIPLLAIGLIGLCAPLLDPRPRHTPEPEDVQRVPYAGEVGALLEDPSLLADQRAALAALHKELTLAMETLGGITPKQAAQVERLRRRR